MKNRTIVGLFIAILLSACTSRQGKELLPELLQAEVLMYTHPDSACAILNEMQCPSPSDKLQYATWCLLLTQAQDKSYMDHTSDSLINIAYEYFMEQDDSHRKALVLNYAGRVNEDLGEIEKATELYLQASDEIEKTGDYRLGYLINSNLGIIYAYRSLYDLSLQALQKAHEDALVSKDSIYIAATYSYLGRIYAATERWDEAVSSYQKSVSIAEEIDDTRSLSLGLSELAAVYERTKQYDSALLCLRRAEVLKIKSKNRNLSQTYLGFGDIYRCMAEDDSALVYLNKALDTDNMYTKRSAYHCLYLVTKKLNDYESAIKHNELYWGCRDSVEQINQSNAIAEIKAKYDHEKLKNKNIQLELEHNRILKSGLLALLLFILILAGVVYLYQRRLLSKERTIRRDKDLLRQYVVQMRENESVIRQNEDRIQELSNVVEVHFDSVN